MLIERCPAAAVVSLSKEFYSHYMFHLMVEGSGGTLDAHTIIHEACAALLQGH